MSNPETKGHEIRVKLLHALRHLFLHNAGFKLLALLISVVLWAGLISQDKSLTRDKVFSNVSVNVTGSDTMKRNGYIVVSDLNSMLEGVTAVSAVPQQQYDLAEASAYNIRLDLSRISGTGTQELRLLSTASTAYGRVTSLNPASISLEVEDYVVRYRIPVSVSIQGDLPEGWYMATPSVDPPLVVVSGPSSLVNSISRARVFVNPEEVDWKEGTSVFSAGLKLYNRSGEEVNNSLLEVSYDGINVDSVVLEAQILPVRSFDVAGRISAINQVEDGYEVRAIHISPESVNVAARSEVLNQVSELALSDYYVDLAGLTETTNFQVRVSKPSDDAVMSNETITVTVEVAPVEAEPQDKDGNN